MASSKQAQRLITLRKENKLTQAELTKLISELTHRDEAFTVSTISAWETGRRHPSLEVTNILAEIYGVTPDYVQCLTDYRNGKAEINIENIDNMLQQKYAAEIDMSEIRVLDGRPVFVTFHDLAHNDQWGIVNKQLNSIVLQNSILKLTDKSIDKIFIDEPYYNSALSYYSNYPLDLSKLIDMSDGSFWVELTTSDKYMQGLYNGWYHHNEDKTCLINNRGLTLPYEGLHISYYAYSKVSYAPTVKKKTD